LKYKESRVSFPLSYIEIRIAEFRSGKSDSGALTLFLINPGLLKGKVIFTLLDGGWGQ